jgi:mono/diheme cytochrome c family protein
VQTAIKNQYSRKALTPLTRKTIITLLLVGSTVCSGANEAVSSPQDKIVRSPQKVFEDTCAYCHGHYIAPGMQVIRDIRGRGLPPELTKTWVRNGMGVMPAFRHTEISDEELNALADWIKTSEAPPPPPMPPMPPQAMPKGVKSE